MESLRSPRHRRVRIYRGLRSAHLERFHVLEPASILYGAENYDFSPALLGGLDVQRFRTIRQACRCLFRADVRQLEINEPMMLGATMLSVAAVATVHLRAVLSRRPIRVVAYAIENKDPFASGQARVRTRWRRFVYRSATRWLIDRVDRLAVGTPGALDEYRPYLRSGHSCVQLIPALPTACPTCPPLDRAPRPAGVVFVGAFDERKGLRQLLAAWPLVRAAMPEVPLQVLGKGALAALAAEACADDPLVEMITDPSREQIHHAMRCAKVLVLLSQPSTTWREQVGLPIVEGLSHGCVIVTTDETGLASWLQSRGHQVVAAHPSVSSEPGLVARAIQLALLDDRSPADVVADLPEVDGRLAADRWMFAEES